MKGRILGLKLYNKVTQAQLMERTKEIAINPEVRRRQWHCIGQTRRKHDNDILTGTLRAEEAQET